MPEVPMGNSHKDLRAASRRDKDRSISPWVIAVGGKTSHPSSGSPKALNLVRPEALHCLTCTPWFLDMRCVSATPTLMSSHLPTFDIASAAASQARKQRLVRLNHFLHGQIRGSVFMCSARHGAPFCSSERRKLGNCSGDARRIRGIEQKPA